MRVDPHQRQVRRVLQVSGHRACKRGLRCHQDEGCECGCGRLTETDRMITANGQELRVLRQHQLHLLDQGTIAGHEVRVVPDVMVVHPLLLEKGLVHGVLQVSVVPYHQAIWAINHLFTPQL